MRSNPGLLAILLLAACGDDGGSPIDSGLHIDAAADASPDADPSLAPLVGTWLKGPDSWSGQMVPKAVFRANGTVTIGDTNPDEGTYSVPTAGRLRMVFASDTIESEFVIGNNHLLLSAMLPQGTVTGLVGTWKSTFMTGGVAGTTTQVINNNNTGSYTLMGPSGSQKWTGTWAAEGTGLVFTATTPSAVTYHYRPIGMAGIGLQLLTKQ
jgi:hypothetical protein